QVFELTKGFPREEIFSLTDQLRRSSLSIGANIAEAWHKRRYPAHFVSKLTDADGEQAETEHWIDTAYACQYVSAEDRDRLLELTRAIGGMLGKMISEPEAFCRKTEQ
ncbi:MAG: four helix bundle protein, partial [Wenzhouxiangella sp.]